MALVSRLDRIRGWLALASAWTLVGLCAAPAVHSQDKTAQEQKETSAEDKAQAALLKDYPKLRDLDTHCPFTPPESLEAWKERSADDAYGEGELDNHLSFGVSDKDATHVPLMHNLLDLTDDILTCELVLLSRLGRCVRGRLLGVH